MPANGRSDFVTDDGLHRRSVVADEVATPVPRLACRDEECVQRIGRLKSALRALLDDLECRVKAPEPLTKALRDLPTVLREAREALAD